MNNSSNQNRDKIRAEKRAETIGNVGAICIITLMILVVVYLVWRRYQWENYAEKQDISKLVEQLNHEDRHEQLEAIKILSFRKDSQAVEGLIYALTADDDRRVRVESVKALVEIKDMRAVRPLLSCEAWDDDPDVQKKARWALSQLATYAPESFSQELRNNLLAVAHSSDFLIRLGHPGTENILIDALQKFGDKTMAEHYLNCGNRNLADAADVWASHHDYFIRPTLKEGTGPGWGSKQY